MVYTDESLKTTAAGLTRNHLGKTLLVSSYTNRRATGISSARKGKEEKIKNQKSKTVRMVQNLIIRPKGQHLHVTRARPLG
jgi:hypothetical protein